MPIDPEILHNVPIFQLLDKDELQALCGSIEEAQFSPGQTIFKAGEPGGAMHVVLSGKVENSILDEDGKRVVLAIVEPGEIFGELSLFDGDPRSADAFALEATRTAVVDRDDLAQLFGKKPHAALDVLTVLSRRLRKTDVLLSQRAARNPNLVIEEQSSFGERVADGVARFGGSWSFINFFTAVMLVWMVLNLWGMAHPLDPPPFIGLNLILSMLAALQAPVIMMSQNRQDSKDRVRSELDYQVNLKAEVEIMELHDKVERLKSEIVDRLDRIESAKR